MSARKPTIKSATTSAPDKDVVREPEPIEIDEPAEVVEPEPEPEPLVDPEPLPHALVDPEPMADPTPQAVMPPVRVRVLRNETSVSVGGAHYSLQAGSTMTVQQHIADELVARKLAERA